ncbi:triosephosphate isomerase [Solimonas aquatica]|uniref:Triosephosphate isomerase n=1 Tax=Solimonas aquatica TaxID=489703 RepID=A0A1H9I353_9GAMM|nr:triose-phosphate isomerase [Solimonas aquatica]SEQ69019.1 triosephosphate isomerase [Solimonas aquatica]
MARRKMVAGNWKMNGARDANAMLLHDIVFDAKRYTAVDMVVCPPALYLESVGAALTGSSVQLGAQNLCEQEKPGAFTGEIHGGMLKDVGCAYVIVGHSERRALYGESDEVVAQKFQTALACGLKPILCLGETLEERESEQTEIVLGRQLAAVLARVGANGFKSAVIAYEPVWAIGTGRTASAEQAQAAHAFIRGELANADAKIADSTRILYGGSVKADNAQALFSCRDVDGGLIGGASLKATEFLAICAAAQTLS